MVTVERSQIPKLIFYTLFHDTQMDPNALVQALFGCFFFCITGYFERVCFFLLVNSHATDESLTKTTQKQTSVVEAVRIGFIFKLFFFCLEQTVPSSLLVVFRSLRSIKFNINCWTDESSLQRAHFKKCIQWWYCMLVFSQLLYLCSSSPQYIFFSDYVAYTCFNFVDQITYCDCWGLDNDKDVINKHCINIYAYKAACRFLFDR